MIKKTPLWVITIFFFLSIYYAEANGVAKIDEYNLDRIVAIVNSDVITKKELDKKIALLKQYNNHQVSETKLRKLALDSLIDELLQIQLAERHHMHISDKDIDRAIREIAKNNKITLKQLEQELPLQTGLDIKQYRKQIGKQLLLSQIRASLLRDINISNEEVVTFLKKQKKAVVGSLVKYHILDFLIEISDVSSDKQIDNAKNIAIKLAASLRLNNDYNKIIEEYSNDDAVTQKISSDDLGWRKIDELPPLFIDKIAKMTGGQISDPIYAPNGFHVLKLIELSEESIQLTKNQAKEMVYNQKAEKRLKPWLKELREMSYIKVIK